MKSGTRFLHDGRWVETCLALVIFGALIYNTYFTITHGYYPQPFFYEPSDTFAHWFNTAYWARRLGTYDLWTALYPPISFVFLRFFGLDYCYPGERPFDFSAGLAARSCDWVGLVTIFALYFADIALAWFSFRRIDRSRALMRTVCFGIGYPLMSGLERGNLVLVAVMCVMLAFGPLLQSSRWKAVFAGVAVNFKVYLIAAIIPLIIRRRWGWVERATLAAVVVYLITYAMLGRGSPLVIATNIIDFTSVPSVDPLDLWSDSTVVPATRLLDSPSFPIMMLIGSHAIAVSKVVLPALLHGTQGLVLLAAVFAALRPEAVTSASVITLGIILALITAESGGYSTVYYMYFVLMEPWRGKGRKLAVILCYVIAIPLEYRLSTIDPVVRDSYIGGTNLIVQYYVGLTPFLRPFVSLAIAATIALTTITDVWADIQLQGWSERWRFRRDTPLLPWVRHPMPLPADIGLADHPPVLIATLPDQ